MNLGKAQRGGEVGNRPGKQNGTEITVFSCFMGWNLEGRVGLGSLLCPAKGDSKDFGAKESGSHRGLQLSILL